MLILFDIDGTLLHSLSAGIHAMGAALRELHGTDPDWGKVEVHGRLDTLIWRELGAVHGYPLDDAAHAAFRDTYAGHLERRLAERNTVEALPGAAALVDAAAGLSGTTIGLLTGNYERTGRLKVRHAGIDPDRFVVNAWGDDGPDRRSLVPVAMNRYRERHARAVDPQQVLIIGDTPYDVDCARAAGARVLATATGKFTVDELHAAGADRTVPDLSDTASIMRWIASGQ
jgi:phosphoglycolate phosphatase-like HAD superfamily hydrolase